MSTEEDNRYVNKLGWMPWTVKFEFHIIYIRDKISSLCFFSNSNTEIIITPGQYPNRWQAGLYLKPLVCQSLLNIRRDIGDEVNSWLKWWE